MFEGGVKRLDKDAVRDCLERVKWRNVTQVTVLDAVYVPFEEYKRDVERLRQRVNELEEIHKKAKALFGKVEYRERDTSCSWRD